MNCPECGEECNRVIDTTASNSANKIFRIRKCQSCGYPWATEEKVVEKFEKTVKPLSEN